VKWRDLHIWDGGVIKYLGLVISFHGVLCDE